MLNTAIGVGAGLSNVLAGFVVKSAGYNVGFLILAAMPAAGYAYAVLALAVFWFCVPETKTGVDRKASPQKHIPKS